ncbi:class I SAM-dependent methyltransferase [Sphingomonas paeninsulae]|uniref:Class I SAM-dependent methyltransferase n=1 Tax=Sphingomonas paeninsulae TaxID=2319844 RepID=A0A494TNV3_SPHPE|nr:cyclopropane-fatty-acyl-phospholipid synthase family protein [Sphingomonas paeninsulae]AYJ87486.1 class I SAM-dependent methyltransferase [Sphingomonas paeninsulae]
MNASTPARGRDLARRIGWVERLSAKPFDAILDRIDEGLQFGTIEASFPDGTVRIFGGRGAGPNAVVSLHRWRGLLRLATSGSVGWYEAWAANEWSSPDSVPLFDLFMRNRATLGRAARGGGISRIIKRARHWLHRNNRSGARRNIIAHYDLGNDFYAAWLDLTMSYSSALFVDSTQSEALSEAQQRKMDATLDRLDLSPGQTLLEIGCGWGGLLARASGRGIKAVGLTLSPSQKRYADHALAGSATVSLTDYRDISGQFDGIASVEMVEAVGQEYWPDFLDSVSRCLKSGGRAAIQFISIADDIFESYASSADFIQTFIFPGGMLLSTSRFRALAEARGLSWTAQHDFGQDYAETLRRWRENFDAALEQGGLPQGFDGRFVALWRYYLMYCEGGFRSGGIQVSQVTLVKQA